jgi:hypothetical protein
MPETSPGTRPSLRAVLAAVVAAGSPSLPFQQESVYPCPVRQNPAWLRFRRDVLRDAVKAFAEPRTGGLPGCWEF